MQQIELWVRPKSHPAFCESNHGYCNYTAMDKRKPTCIHAKCSRSLFVHSLPPMHILRSVAAPGRHLPLSHASKRVPRTKLLRGRALRIPAAVPAAN